MIAAFYKIWNRGKVNACGTDVFDSVRFLIQFRFSPVGLTAQGLDACNITFEV